MKTQRIRDSNNFSNKDLIIWAMKCSGTISLIFMQNLCYIFLNFFFFCFQIFSFCWKIKFVYIHFPSLTSLKSVYVIFFINPQQNYSNPRSQSSSFNALLVISSISFFDHYGLLKILHFLLKNQ